MIPLLFGAPLVILLLVFFILGREADKIDKKEKEENQH